MLKDSDTPRYAVRRTNRTYSSDTKAALLAACIATRVSIAVLASAHGTNANVLHRWLKESSQTRGFCDASSVETADQDMPAFIPVPLRRQSTEHAERTIKAEVRKGSLSMTVAWPMSAANDFAFWSASVFK